MRNSLAFRRLLSALAATFALMGVVVAMNVPAQAASPTRAASPAQVASEALFAPALFAPALFASEAPLVQATSPSASVPLRDVRVSFTVRNNSQNLHVRMVDGEGDRTPFHDPGAFGYKPTPGVGQTLAIGARQGSNGPIRRLASFYWWPASGLTSVEVTGTWDRTFLKYCSDSGQCVSYRV